MLFASERSSAVTVQTPPVARICDANASSACCLRAAMVTAAPAFASSWAKWAPRPLDAPVTKAVFPVRSSRSRILTPSAAVFRLWIKIVDQSRGAALGGDVEMKEYGPSGEQAGSARPGLLGITRDLGHGRMVPGQPLAANDTHSTPRVGGH